MLYTSHEDVGLVDGLGIDEPVGISDNTRSVGDDDGPIEPVGMSVISYDGACVGCVGADEPVGMSVLSNDGACVGCVGADELVGM